MNYDDADYGDANFDTMDDFEDHDIDTDTDTDKAAGKINNVIIFYSVFSLVCTGLQIM